MSALPPRLKSQSDDSLFALYGSNGSLAAREEIARRYMPMARRLTRRYRNSSETRDDLEQVAYVGLLKTIDRYDRNAGAFSSYVITTIRGELKRHFRDHGWMMNVTRPVQERSLLVSAATSTMTVRNGRPPTVRELAAETQLDMDLVIEALEAAQGYAPLSLDAPVGTGPDDAAGVLVDTIGHEETGFAAAELRATITPIVDQLPERERRILHLRFVEDRTQSDIAEECGLSQMHVSRLLRSTIRRLLEAADPQALDQVEAAAA